VETENSTLDISVIIPTYNESQNILTILKSVEENLPKKLSTEIIVVDDNSPDRTGQIVDNYIKNKKNNFNNRIKIIHRKEKRGLSSAIIEGIQNSLGELIVVMDSDFSHPPAVINRIIEEFNQFNYDIVIASRYVKGAIIRQWPYKRKIISKVATKISKSSLGINVSDPLSGFFAFKRDIIHGINFDAIGYKMLLEMLVKIKGARIKEIPYTFTDRKSGTSKFSLITITDYIKSVWKLYRYGKAIKEQEKRISIRFLSKAARFYSVGASGLVVNYLTTLLFTSEILNFWYLHANIFGIFVSMTSNFILNKLWTFEEKDFLTRKVLKQFGQFIGFSSLGAIIQLEIVFLLVEGYQMLYPLALILGVLAAAFGNFSLNKKFTFHEKFWS
jgi:dolichol-phosphate mannosyltransferase